MDKALAELIKVSNITGKDKRLVQGGGGNTSVKTADGKYMYIKASGTALRDMDAKRGWRRLKLKEVLDVIDDKKLSKMHAAKREAEIVRRLEQACDDNINSGAFVFFDARLFCAADHLFHQCKRISVFFL